MEQSSEAAPGGVDAALLGLAQKRFELGEDRLDRIEAGSVRRQEQQAGTGRPDGVAHGASFVRVEVVHDHDVARIERGHEILRDIGQDVNVSGH